ncbi:type III restriction enzyme res subunit [Scytonema sp. HK-05]|uniref:DEAD/DEAH box helicase family protein n=1 Tax=Scytonema sp. HK-05 TaxID=1137095 RepID=UPI00093699E5|nr:DEAD/DEAH box helicase family protein [Scytonema sp. HK-05]OKH43376.1 hypothetical protein NIES2130_38790 [Scytonema sp. HK-05]BAY47585.1 type III restriction enzyme res subunit [Scytonema sp. HK-05]
MASNFDFLNNRYPDLFKHASHAETLVYTAPRASCFYTRFTLEQAVLWLYAHDTYLQIPYDTKLSALIHEQTFQENLKPGLFPKIRTIHKIGNIAVHESTPIKEKDALHLVEELFHFLYWLSRSYSPNAKNHPTVNFDRNLIPHPTATSASDLSVQQLQTLEAQLSQADEMRRIAEARQQQTEQELAVLQAEIAALKQQNAAVTDNHNYNEEETRHYLIDVLLKEAGWNIDQGGWTEYEVQGMPNDTGKGRVDYVLWGDDGKPLALVEAKRTRKSSEAGKHQAKLYADCLEQRFGQRPVIFYTNGYDYWIWDDLNYPPRQIQGFLKKDELERLIFGRSHRKRLHLVQITSSIVERCYQSEAIRRITETFDEKKGRKALLVMATGTGKTRTAIALVDLLMRANWVKRVLFLADRNALLTQALRAFKSHLPTATAVDITKGGDAHSANVVLKRNVPLTDADLTSLEEMLFGAAAIESRERFEEVYGKNLSLKLFIRQLVGLDRNTAKQAFAQYLEGSTFNANQIRFVEIIIDYLTQNGVMDAGLLYEPPFTDLHYEGLDGVFEADDADQIISIVRCFNETVGKKFGVA